MPDDDHQPAAPQPQPTQLTSACGPTFRDLLAATEAARRVSTPPPAEARVTVPDEDAA
jgi:hypothetical protein